jgi:hypothetical protein
MYDEIMKKNVLFEHPEVELKGYCSGYTASSMKENSIVFQDGDVTVEIAQDVVKIYRSVEDGEIEEIMEADIVPTQVIRSMMARVAEKKIIVTYWKVAEKVNFSVAI